MSHERDMVHDHVTDADLDESLDMLKTRVGQANAVFACFGSAAQNAQYFEAALSEFLLDYNKLAKRSLTPQDFEILDEKLQKRTLGMLLREFSKYVKISDPNVERLLEKALERRNFLMHHFFRQKDFTLRLENDRVRLISSLTNIDRILQESATIIRAMRIAMSEGAARKTALHRNLEDAADDSRVLFTASVTMPDEAEANGA